MKIEKINCERQGGLSLEDVLGEDTVVLKCGFDLAVTNDNGSRVKLNNKKLKRAILDKSVKEFVTHF